MKKFYTLLAAVLCLSLVATAAPVKKSAKSIHRSELTAKRAQKPAARKLVKKVAKADAAFPAVAEIAGNYTWSFIDSYFGVAMDRDIMINVAADGSVSIDGLLADLQGYLSNEKLIVDASYDPADGTLSIAKQLVGYDDEYSENVYFCALDLVENPAYDANDEESFEYLLEEHDGPFIFNYENGEFVSADEMVLLGAIGENVEDGFYIASEENVLTPAIDWSIGWSDAGSVKYSDAWILPGVSETPADFDAYPVVWQVNDENPNLVRMLNPFGEGSPVAEDNMNTEKDGYIIFDITDPDCVLVLANVYSGFEDYFYGSYYCYDAAGIYSSLGFSTEEIKTSLEAEALTTLKDGVITVADPLYGLSGERDACYTWWDENETPMAAKIYLEKSDNSGIENVGIEAAGSAAEYFTLQGVRVERPSSGLYICRRGDSAVKVMVK